MIFDAEDNPHPKQVREAARRFARSDKKLACLQAPLRITPRSANWLYWLCMLPAYLNALKRLALGLVDWLKSPHIPFLKMTPRRAILERVKGIEPSS